MMGNLTSGSFTGSLLLYAFLFLITCLDCHGFIHPSTGDIEISRNEIYYLKASFINSYGTKMMVNVSNNPFINFAGINFTAGQGGHVFMIPIDINSTIPNEVYNLSIPVSFSPVASDKAEVRLVRGVVLRYRINLSGKQTISSSIVNMSAYPCEGLCYIDILLRNNGTVSFSPMILIKSKNYTELTICSEAHPNQEIYCRAKFYGYGNDSSDYQSVAFSLDYNTIIYQKNITVQIMEKNNTLDIDNITINIYPKGALSFSGRLLDVEVNDCSYGEIAKLAVIFNNTGKKPLEVGFISEIYSNKGLLKVIESDIKAVMPGETVILKDYYYPPRPGEYELRTHGVFAGRNTDELIRTIKVSSAQNIWSRVIIIGFILLVVFILFRKY
jgi:hypothetical protein